ncbi:MAG: cytochrome c peroxidase [Saprospiraceae bacterium]
MNKESLWLCICIVFFSSCAKDITQEEDYLDAKLKKTIEQVSETNSASYYILPSDVDYSNIPQDPKNPLTKEKVELGKMLFYETGFGADAKFDSGMATYACVSCHIPAAGFTPGSAQGIADGGSGFGENGEMRVKSSEYQESDMDVQSIRPLSLVNVAYVTNTFWNGQFGGKGINEGTDEVWPLEHATEANSLGFAGIETQNFEGLISHRYRVDEEIIDDLGYRDMFDAGLPNMSEEERYSIFGASLALSAYIRTILSNKAPFQEWLKGDHSAMTKAEKEGAIIFFGNKARCTNCHYRTNLGSLEFHAIGAKDMYQRPSYNTFADDRNNLGRAGFTLRDEDMFAFKVPQLYNLSDANFLFHGSSLNTLSEVLDYKINAVSENSNVSNEQLSDKFQPIALSQIEKENLLLFLSNSLRDPELERYQPDELRSGNCFPNNDLQSRIDLGCN